TTPTCNRSGHASELGCVPLKKWHHRRVSRTSSNTHWLHSTSPKGVRRYPTVAAAAMVGKRPPPSRAALASAASPKQISFGDTRTRPFRLIGLPPPRETSNPSINNRQDHPGRRPTATPQRGGR